MSDTFDVIVIGGGTAGLVTASGCARLGRRVALVERHALGGDCLWTGCVPTKALVASAKLAHRMRHANAFGIAATEPQIDPRAVMESMRAIRREIARHDAPERFRRLGIEVIEGSARFVRRDAIAVGGREITGKDIVIATGSRTSIPPVDGLHETGFLDHASFLDRDDFPRSVVILGGGSIGIEFAQILSRFGSAVTVIETADEIVGREDETVIARLKAILTAEGIAIHTSCCAESARREGGKKIVRTRNADGTTSEFAADEIFIGCGRRGNTDGLGLEELGMKMDGSYVAVNPFLETSVARIWACGDVHGGLQFTHAAAFEAVRLVRNMLFPGKSKISYEHIPWTLFTDPEAAHIGMTEREAREAFGDDVRVHAAEMADIDRAVVDREASGFVKLVSDRKGRIHGAHVLGANASTLIEVIVLARKRGAKVGDLAQLVSSYPSLADAIQKAATGYYEGLSSGWLGLIGKRLASWTQ